MREVELTFSFVHAAIFVGPIDMKSITLTSTGWKRFLGCWHSWFPVSMAWVGAPAKRDITTSEPSNPEWFYVCINTCVFPSSPTFYVDSFSPSTGISFVCLFWRGRLAGLRELHRQKWKSRRCIGAQPASLLRLLLQWGLLSRLHRLHWRGLQTRLQGRFLAVCIAASDSSIIRAF